MSYANNKGADQPGHPRRLISAFVVRCLDSVMSLVSVTKISSRMLASVAEQASLSPEDTFCHVMADNDIFFQGNFVLECEELLDLQKEEYDVILALSITKWIHFNWGDIGLKRFFKRIFRQLKPGGKLVLEPQPWSSYKKKKKLTVCINLKIQNVG